MKYSLPFNFTGFYIDGVTSMLTDRQIQILDNNFTYHPPKGTQQERYENLRAMAKVLATEIMESSKESREQSLAITKLEEAIFWANAAIARNE